MKVAAKTRRKSGAKRAPGSETIRAQVRDYFAKLPPASRKRLTQMRAAIRAVAPNAIPHFSYGIPGFRLNEQPLVWYGAFARHTSLFPLTPGMRTANAANLTGFKVSKGTVQFPLSKPLPVALVKKLVAARAAEVRR